MVGPLKLVQFYGSQLPRPRIYDDVKYSECRVDPPPSVNDALLNWARDAHWSKGGLSFRHGRLAGTVEGSIRRLRDLEEDEDVEEEENLAPPPPLKRRRPLETVAPAVEEAKEESPLMKISRDRAAMAKSKKGKVAESLTEKIRKVQSSPPLALKEAVEKSRKAKAKETKAKEPQEETVTPMEKLPTTKPLKRLQKASVETPSVETPAPKELQKASKETQSPTISLPMHRRSSRLSLEASPPSTGIQSEDKDSIIPASSSPSGKGKSSVKPSAQKRKSLPMPTLVSRRKLVIKEDSSDDNSSEGVEPPRRASRRQSR